MLGTKCLRKNSQKVESYIPISFLNDFIFCPRSIYFHQLYGRITQRLYQTTDQIRGTDAHKTIDRKKYTTAKTVLQGLAVFSEKYGIGGKIDLFDLNKSLLVERKKKIKVIYDGYIYQLYAQYYCLTEMGYQVKKMKLYSMDDNKSYPVKLPVADRERQEGFEKLIQDIYSFDLKTPFLTNINKCRHCIYCNLCDVTTC